MGLKKEYIYFVGVGGIGMSALARYFNQLGRKVAGYDRTITDLTKRLQEEGIAINYVAEADAIPFPHRNKEEVLVVYTPAISEDNPILVYFQEEGFECLKRAEVLGLLSADSKTIAVAGTHGKTTVSSMIAFVLRSAGLKVNAFLGGISRNFGTNLLLDPEAELMVTEADEYDRSFLQLSPSQLIITSIDADHLDIYEDEKDLKETYSQLIAQTINERKLFSKPHVLKELDGVNEVDSVSYSIEDSASIQAKNIHVNDGNFVFDYSSPNHQIKSVSCGLPGLHNVENAVAAMSVALELGVDAITLKRLIGEFTGVKRRFDVHLKNKDIVYIDDYAHHPEELKMLMSSVRELYPDKKVTLIFQPHLFSRTRDFGGEFANVLATADDLILLDIYPAREEPIEGIDSLWLSKQMKKPNVPVCGKHQLIKILKSREVEVLVTAGAGDIDTMIDPIIQLYGVIE